MSTDNNKVLQNSVKRSSFNLESSLKTSLGLGRIQPVNVKYLLPHDTISDKTDMFLEMKSTTTKLNSTVRLHDRKFLVPFRSIWKDFDKFASIKENTYRSANANDTYGNASNDLNVCEGTPFFTREDVILHFLCASMPGKNLTAGSNIEHELNYGKQESAYYKRQYHPRYLRDASYSGITGGYPCTAEPVAQVYKRYASGGQISTLGDFNWWLPRVFGDNSEQSQCTYLGKYKFSSKTYANNRKLAAIGIQYDYPYSVASFWNPALIATCKASISAWSDKDIAAVFVFWYYDSSMDTISFYVSYTLTTDTLPKVNAYKAFFGDADSSTTGVGRFFYVHKAYAVSQSTSYRQWSNNVDYYASAGAWNVLCNCFFNNSYMFGAGSLADTLHCPFFVYSRKTDNPLGLYSEYTSFSGTVTTENTHAWYVMFLPEYFRNSSSVTPAEYAGAAKLSYLLFLGYQRAVTDHYMLPYEVFKLNQAGQCNIDSPYFRNLAVPICIETPTTADCDVLKYGVTNAGYYFTGSSSTAAADSHYKEHHFFINNLLSAFLNRAPLIDVDMATRMWRLRDNGLGQASSADAIVIGSDMKLTGRAKMLAKKIQQIKNCGDTNLPYAKFLENQFDVNGVDTGTLKSVFLGGSQFPLVITDTTATDTDSLGQKVSTSQTLKSGKDSQNSVTFFNQEDALFYELVHLSVDTEYFNYVTPEFRNLVKTSKEDWQQMTMPQYQDAGDDELKGFEFNQLTQTTDDVLGFTNRNYWLKDDVSKISGDYESKYADQLAVNGVVNGADGYPLELSYAYMQKPSWSYHLPFSDMNGDKFLLNCLHRTYKKSCMTRDNVARFS